MMAIYLLSFLNHKSLGLNRIQAFSPNKESAKFVKGCQEQNANIWQPKEARNNKTAVGDMINR